MADIETPTPFAIAHYRKEGYARQEMDVMAVRATFQWSHDDAPLKLAHVQQPIRWGETYEGPSDQTLRCVVASDGDTEIGKPTTDIHVAGHLQSPSGVAQADWLAGVAVGPVRKLLRVCGPRQFERGFAGWRLTKPTPVERIRLDYRRAFGGIAFATTLDEHGHPEYCAFSGNPAGVGWLPDGADLKPLTKTAREQIEHDIKSIKVLDAPQFEAVDRPVRSPFDRHPTQGLGPIVRWWSPRKERQGTLDEIWRQSRYPEWPYDFDARFYNSAHPDLMSPSLLRGDEAISLGNCVRQGTTLRGSDRILSTRLPGMTVYAQADFGDDQIQLLDFVLDTVGIDLDRQEVTLTWHRLCMPQQTLKRAVIHGMPLDMWDQLKHRAADGARKP